jgi:hypothetical protein
MRKSVGESRPVIQAIVPKLCHAVRFWPFDLIAVIFR